MVLAMVAGGAARAGGRVGSGSGVVHVLRGGGNGADAGGGDGDDEESCLDDEGGDEEICQLGKG